MQGWTLGLIEAICATIVVGFSVDYVVHYAIAYVNAPQPTREGKVTHAMIEVGISVMAGAITTMGASAFLLLTTVQFFFKFGIFMLSTVAFSIFTANVAFTALLAVLGPTGDTGNLYVYGARAGRAMGLIKAKSHPGEDKVAASATSKPVSEP
mmetsp:Transcript_24620/g.66956  ORF Transcript_24620/g.66956 Transcript_24620/m.66956 type:complete len:153 (-) Transcript_24620:306-764(-)